MDKKKIAPFLFFKCRTIAFINLSSALTKNTFINTICNLFTSFQWHISRAQRSKFYKNEKSNDQLTYHGPLQQKCYFHDKFKFNWEKKNTVENKNCWDGKNHAHFDILMNTSDNFVFSLPCTSHLPVNSSFRLTIYIKQVKFVEQIFAFFIASNCFSSLSWFHVKIPYSLSYYESRIHQTFLTRSMYVRSKH